MSFASLSQHNFVKAFCDQLKWKIIDDETCVVKVILVIGFPCSDRERTVMGMHHSLIKGISKAQPNHRSRAVVLPLMLCANILQLRHYVLDVLMYLKFAPALITVIGHGIDDGSNLALSSGEKLSAVHIAELFFQLAKLPFPQNFKMAMFLNCDAGKSDRLLHQLQSLHPVTTLSFQRELFFTEVANSIPYSKNVLSQFLVNYILYMLGDHVTLGKIGNMREVPKHSEHTPVQLLMYQVAYEIESGFAADADTLFDEEFAEAFHNFMMPGTFQEALDTFDVPQRIRMSANSLIRRFAMICSPTLIPMDSSQFPVLHNVIGWSDPKWWKPTQPYANVEPRHLFHECHDDLLKLWYHNMFGRDVVNKLQLNSHVNL